MVRAPRILWLHNQRFATESFAIKLSSEISVLIFFLFFIWSQGELQKCEPLSN